MNDIVERLSVLSSFLRKIFYPFRSACLTYVVFALGCFLYFGFSPFYSNIDIFFHNFFYIVIGINCLVLICFNRSESFFETLLIFAAYILLNNIKRANGIAYWSDPAYCYLSAALPLNLCFFFFYKNRFALFSKNTIFIFLILLLQYSAFENLALNKINLLYFPSVFGLNNLTFTLFVCVLVLCFIKINRFDGIGYTADFFKILSVFLGFLLSVQISAVCLFFALAAILGLLETLSSIYQETFYDATTGAFNRHSYFKHEAKGFPLKYCVSVIRIDNIDSVIQNYRYRVFLKLLKMIAGRLNEAPEISGIYRLSEDIFLLVFFDKNREDGFEIMENIRRNMAVSEFILKHRKINIKITITSAVAERKRSDFEVTAIITRAYNKMKSSLSQNVTLKA